MTITRASAWAGGCCACAWGATRIAAATMAAPAPKRRSAACNASFLQWSAGMTTSIQARAILHAFWLFVCSGDGLIATRGSAFPGRSAAPKARLRASCARYGDALQTRDRNELRVCGVPGSALHHHSASKTRVNALMALHRIRETNAMFA